MKGYLLSSATRWFCSISSNDRQPYQPWPVFFLINLRKCKCAFSWNVTMTAKPLAQGMFYSFSTWAPGIRRHTLPASFWRRYFLIKYIREAADRRTGQCWKLKGKRLSKQIEARRSWLVLLASLLIGTGRKQYERQCLSWNWERQLRLNNVMFLSMWTTLCS